MIDIGELIETCNAHITSMGRDPRLNLFMLTSYEMELYTPDYQGPSFSEK